MARPRASAPPGYLTSEQVCARLGISKPTLGRWRDAGKLDALVYRGVLVYVAAEITRLEKVWTSPQRR